MVYVPISLSLHERPAHAALIGDMLLGYADLEFFILDLVGQAIGGVADDAVSILYRLRGAEDRLNVADALVRPFMRKCSLIGPYGQWLGAMRRCKAIRNQFAHCAWGIENDRLCFATFYEAAARVDGPGELEFIPIDMTLLQEQQAYFAYTFDLTMYLMAEARFRRDRRRRHHRTIPTSLAAPKMHSPQD